jgi:hypothetical protein
LLNQVTHAKPFTAPTHSSQVHFSLFAVAAAAAAAAPRLSLIFKVLYIVINDGVASSLSYPASTDRSCVRV